MKTSRQQYVVACRSLAFFFQLDSSQKRFDSIKVTLIYQNIWTGHSDSRIWIKHSMLWFFLTVIFIISWCKHYLNLMQQIFALTVSLYVVCPCCVAIDGRLSFITVYSLTRVPLEELLSADAHFCLLINHKASRNSRWHNCMWESCNLFSVGVDVCWAGA